MGVFVKPAPSREEAEDLIRLLSEIRDVHPGARLHMEACEEPVSGWCVVVEADDLDPTTLKQECLDLLGE